MAKYTEQFQLSPEDIHLIEEALRLEIALRMQSAPDSPEFESARQRTRDLHGVLGKLYNQKIFYAQVNATGTPAG